MRLVYLKMLLLPLTCLLLLSNPARAAYGFSSLFGFGQNEACSNHDCVNGACVATGGGYECICYPGFKGSKCETECLSPEPVGLPVECNPINAVEVLMTTDDQGCPLYEMKCKNQVFITGNRSLSQDTTSSAVTDPKYTGKCQTENVCVQGTCIEFETGDTECICKSGWVGLNCDTACKVDASSAAEPLCDFNAMRLLIQPTGGCPLIEILCEHELQKRSHLATDACPCHPCENGGTCSAFNETDGGGICICPNEWTDPFCGTPCPCMNGGTCIYNTTSSSITGCNCPDCAVGSLCQQDNTRCMCPPTATRYLGENALWETCAAAR